MTEPPAMPPETARARFSDALDGALAPDERRAFDAALAADPDLRADWEAFEASVGAARRLRGAAPPAPPLLPGVQRALRQRSRGRYYRDRFAEAAGGRPLLGLAVATVLLLLALAAGLAASWVPARPVRTPPPAAGAGR